MPGVLASFDSEWGATFTVLLLAVGLWVAVVALRGWWVSRTPVGAVVACLVAFGVVGVVVRAYPEGNTGFVASLPTGLLAGVGSAGLLRVSRSGSRLASTARRSDEPPASSNRL